MALAIRAAIPEQLRQKLDILSLSATGTGSGELEERLQQLVGFDAAQANQAAIIFRQIQEKFPIFPFLHPDGRLRHHINCFATGLLFIPRGTHIHAKRAPGAVLRRDLYRIVHARLEIAALCRH